MGGSSRLSARSRPSAEHDEIGNGHVPRTYGAGLSSRSAMAAVGAPAEERGGSHASSIDNTSGSCPVSAGTRTRTRAGCGGRRICERRFSGRRVGWKPARLRPERDRLRPEHAGQRDPGNRRRDPCPAGRRRDEHEPLRAPVQAGRVRNSHRAAADEGRLLHRGRRPRRLADGRDDQRQDRGLQPLPRERGHEQLRRPGQLLAHAVQPDAEHQQPSARTAVAPRRTSGRSRRPCRCAVSTSAAPTSRSWTTARPGRSSPAAASSPTRTSRSSSTARSSSG